MNKPSKQERGNARKERQRRKKLAGKKRVIQAMYQIGRRGAVGEIGDQARVAAIGGEADGEANLLSEGDNCPLCNSSCTTTNQNEHY
jgi:hypothetical protein